MNYFLQFLVNEAPKGTLLVSFMLKLDKQLPVPPHGMMSHLDRALFVKGLDGVCDPRIVAAQLLPDKAPWRFDRYLIVVDPWRDTE